jgi:hypothetical protein
MPALPAEVSSAYIEAELPAVRSLADREGVGLDFLPDRSALRLRLEGPPKAPEETPPELIPDGSPEHYLLEGVLDDYRALPPDWNFLHPDTAEDIGAAAFPAVPRRPIGGNSIFLPHGGSPVICAHFSRRAYGPGAPHNEWGPATGWQTVQPGNVRADTLADMLARIICEVRISDGRMEVLP